MDPHFLDHFLRELQFMREFAKEFADEFPKVASVVSPHDPGWPSLLQRSAFLMGEAQQRLDKEFPEASQPIIQKIYPAFISPVPSMTVVQIQPKKGSPKEGFVVPRGSQIVSARAGGDETACQFQTAHDVTLWPIEIVDADYLANAAYVGALGAPIHPGTVSGLRLRLRSTVGLRMNQLKIDRLAIYLQGGEVAASLCELIAGATIEATAQLVNNPAEWRRFIRAEDIRQMGFEDDEGLLPLPRRSFRGYRHLQEYFAFPERFLFIELKNMTPCFESCPDSELDLIFLFDRSSPKLERAVNASNFGLFCTPAVNLFAMEAARIDLATGKTIHHIVPDGDKIHDYEVYSVTDVLGYGDSSEPEVIFLWFHDIGSRYPNSRHEGYYQLRRELEQAPTRQFNIKRRMIEKPRYTRNEIYMTLVNIDEEPYAGDLTELQVKMLCTNRDLPLRMPVGAGATDFTLETGGPIGTIRCLAGPTPPRPSNSYGKDAWKVLSHLKLNHLSLVDNDEHEGAAALREILSLYSGFAEPAVARQIEGLRSVCSVPKMAQIKGDTGSYHVARGLEVTVTFEEKPFEGSGPFVLGAVLREFFRRYVSRFSFTEVVMKTIERGEIMRWTIQAGTRHVI